MGSELAEMAPLAIATLQGFVNDSILQKGPVEHMVETSQKLARVRGRADFAEGIAAYKDKRKPRFTGS